MARLPHSPNINMYTFCNSNSIHAHRFWKSVSMTVVHVQFNVWGCVEIFPWLVNTKLGETTEYRATLVHLVFMCRHV